MLCFALPVCIQDDFDLNEVFAEYFSNEFDIDPLNAYTSSMANYSGGNATQSLPTAAQAHAAALAQSNSSNLQNDAAAVEKAGAMNAINKTGEGGGGGVGDASTVKSSNGFNLPTGGIRTAFHGGSSVPSRPTGVVVPPKKRSKHDEQSQMQALLAPNPLGGPVAALALAHQQAASAAAAQQLQEQQQEQHQQQLQLQGQQQLQTQEQPQQQPQQQQQQTPQQQLTQQAQQQLALFQQLGIQPQQLQQQQLNASVLSSATVTPAVVASSGLAPAPAATDNPAAGTAAGNDNRVSLPVGVGIRLGGFGGIAPSTAQATARPPIMQAQYAAALWGGAAAAAANPAAAAAAAGVMMAGGAPTEQAAAERRQRNREHAKRSRVRKKFMLESMQEQVRSLQIENQNLRMLVQEHIPEHAVSIIAECCTTSPLFAGRTKNEGEQFKEDTATDGTPLGKSDFSLMESLASGQRCFVLSDPKLPDNPIVFASPGFYELTGYTAKEVLGRNCRFLQGPGTDPRAVEVIRKAVSTGADATICLLNYKADGTPFWNQFFIAALRDSDNCIVNYVSQWKVPSGKTLLESLPCTSCPRLSNLTSIVGTIRLESSVRWSRSKGIRVWKKR